MPAALTSAASRLRPGAPRQPADPAARRRRRRCRIPARTPSLVPAEAGPGQPPDAPPAVRLDRRPGVQIGYRADMPASARSPGARRPAGSRLRSLGSVPPGSQPRSGVLPVPRVLVDATAIPAQLRGVGRYLDNLLPALVAAGADVIAVAQARDRQHFARAGHRLRAGPVGAGRPAGPAGLGAVRPARGRGPGRRGPAALAALHLTAALDRPAGGHRARRHLLLQSAVAHPVQGPVLPHRDPAGGAPGRRLHRAGPGHRRRAARAGWASTPDRVQVAHLGVDTDAVPPAGRRGPGRGPGPRPGWSRTRSSSPSWAPWSRARTSRR